MLPFLIANFFSLLPYRVTSILNLKWSISLLWFISFIIYLCISKQQFMQFCLPAFDLSVSVRCHIHSLVTCFFYTVVMFLRFIHVDACHHSCFPFLLFSNLKLHHNSLSCLTRVIHFACFQFALLIMPLSALCKVTLCNFAQISIDCTPRNSITEL